MIDHLGSRDDIPGEAHVITIDHGSKVCRRIRVFDKGSDSRGRSRDSAPIDRLDIVPVVTVRDRGIGIGQSCGLGDDEVIPIDSECIQRP